MTAHHRRRFVALTCLALLWPSGADWPACAAENEAARTDLYGDPLPPGAMARLGTVRLRHYYVGSLAYSPDGKTLASAGDTTIRLWDPRTGKELRRFGPSYAYVTRSVAFSPDGKLLATASMDRNGTVRLWETATGKELLEIPAHNLTTALAFSADGQALLTGGQDGNIYRWRIPTGEALGAFPGARGAARAIAASRDGKLLAAGGQSTAILLWDASTGKPLPPITHEGANVLSLAFFPDSKTLASAFGNNPPRLWDTTTGKEIRPLGPYGYAVASSPDGKSVAVGGTYNVRRWDLTTGRELPRLRGHHLEVSSVAYSPDGATLAAAGIDGVIRLWDLARGQEVLPGAGNDAPVIQAVFSPDGRTVAAGCWGQLALWDRTGKKQRGIPFKDIWVDAVAFAADGKTIASGSHDKVVQLWNTDTGKLLREFRGHEKQVAAVAIAPDGKTLASSGWDNWAYLWDATTGQQLRQFKAYGQAISFSPDSKVLALGQRLWELDTGEELLRTTPGLPGTIRFVGFSGDGNTVWAGAEGGNGEFACWDAHTGKQLRRLKLPAEESTTCYALSPDGRTVAVGGGQRAPISPGPIYRPMVTLWELQTGKVRRRMLAHEGPISAVAFDADGTLLSASADTTILLWEGIRPVPGQKTAAALSPQEVQDRWTALGADDAAPAYDAVRDLVRSPEPAVTWMKKVLQPVRAADAKQTAKLLADLASDKFAERDSASKGLEDLAEGAESILREALQRSPSLETRRRLEQVLQKLDPLKSPARLRSLRAVEVLEWIGSPEARQLLETLAEGISTARLTQEARASLQRLARRGVAKEGV